MRFTRKLAQGLAWRKNLGAIAATIAAAVIIACEIPGTEPGSGVARLVVSPKNVALQPDQSQDFVAVGFTILGDSADVIVTWIATGGSVHSSTSGRRHYGRYTNANCGAFKVVATTEPGGLSDTANVTVSGCDVAVASVSVGPASASVLAGDAVQLTATPKDANGNPITDRTVTWSSSNTSVATVSSSGLVIGVVAGSAIITATSEGQNGTAAITVTNVPVASVAVSPASASIPAGQTVQLTASPKDANGSALTGRTITWSSSNTAVATVNANGLVTGVAAGSATITATSEGKSGTSAITVTAASASVVLVGAGDIANCDAQPTAAILDTIPGTVFTAGDNAYPDGSEADYANCYHPSWGRHKARTRPSPGNHEHRTAGAAGYFGYFGAAAGPGYYSYDIGAWHVISLDSQYDYGVGIDPSTAQGQWLLADLAANTKRCIVAYWHYPRFSSGNHGSYARMKTFWDALYAAGATIVISGHDHHYERFAPQTPDGTADPTRGIRQFVVGTGGTPLYSLRTTLPNSEVRNNNSHGVLKLTLSDGSYTWQFIPIAGDSFTDSGSGTCH